MMSELWQIDNNKTSGLIKRPLLQLQISGGRRFLPTGLLLSLFMLVLFPLHAQIPNPDFEFWDSVTTYQPSGYRIYGVTSRTSGFMSPYAVRLQKHPQLTQTPGAIVYGNPDQGFSGGIQAHGRPDSVAAYFKYHLVPGDSAWFLVFFKKNGMMISQDIFKIGGSDSSAFKRLAFKINYNDTATPDSLIIGVTCTTPDSLFTGSFLVVDNIHFTGGSGMIQVPNGGFEQWDVLGSNVLKNWFTSNINMQGMTGNIYPVTKTTDHKFTSHACRIENISDGQGGYALGYIMAGRQGNFGPLPGFAVQGRDSLLYCHYKSAPQGETVQISIMMYKGDTMVGNGTFMTDSTVSTWTEKIINIQYFHPGIPDSAVIFCSAFPGGTHNPHGNSVLYVDGFSLNKPKVSVFSPWILPAKVYPQPANGELKIILNHAMQVQEVALYDMNGRVYKIAYGLSEDQRSIFIQTTDLPSGSYTYVIKTRSGSISGKIQIIHQ